MSSLTHPLSRLFNQHYWSTLAVGYEEKSHIFLHGNNVPQLLSHGPVTVAELGFGTALNFLLTWAMARQHGAHLTYISYEIDPIPLTTLTAIHEAFPPQLHVLATALHNTYTPTAGWNLWQLEGATLHLYVGDATTGIATHPAPAHCWYLDGFSADINPELWAEPLFAQVYAHTRAGGTATTYSVARAVKESLTHAGFHIEKTKGHPPKQYKLTATKAA